MSRRTVLTLLLAIIACKLGWWGITAVPLEQLGTLRAFGSGLVMVGGMFTVAWVVVHAVVNWLAEHVGTF